MRPLASAHVSCRNSHVNKTQQGRSERRTGAPHRGAPGEPRVSTSSYDSVSTGSCPATQQFRPRNSPRASGRSQRREPSIRSSPNTAPTSHGTTGSPVSASAFTRPACARTSSTTVPRPRPEGAEPEDRHRASRPHRRRLGTPPHPVNPWPLHARRRPSRPPRKRPRIARRSF